MTSLRQEDLKARHERTEPWPDMSIAPSAAYFAPVRLAAVSVSRWRASISTTADTYTDWGVQQLESSLLRTFAVEDDGE